MLDAGYWMADAGCKMLDHSVHNDRGPTLVGTQHPASAIQQPEKTRILALYKNKIAKFPK